MNPEVLRIAIPAAGLAVLAVGAYYAVLASTGALDGSDIKLPEMCPIHLIQEPCPYHDQ